MSIHLLTFTRWFKKYLTGRPNRGLNKYPGFQKASHRTTHYIPGFARLGFKVWRQHRTTSTMNIKLLIDCKLIFWRPQFPRRWLRSHLRWPVPLEDKNLSSRILGLLVGHPIEWFVLLPALPHVKKYLRRRTSSFAPPLHHPCRSLLPILE